MTDQEFNDLKDGYIQFVNKLMQEAGGVDPSITILGTHKNDSNNAIIHVPIPSKYMKTDDMKSEFVDEIIPGIAKKVAEEFNVSVVAWASEAWLRVVEKKDEADLKDWKSLPIKKEVLIVTFESEDRLNTTIFEIARKGKQVNSEGELVDEIELLDLPEYNNEASVASEGRFTGLYKKFTTFT
jgi:hypothetical protein